MDWSRKDLPNIKPLLRVDRVLFQLLCTLTHSPAVTNDGRMMAIVWEDHEVFKTLNSRREDIKGVAITLGGKKKKAMEIETDDEDYLVVHSFLSLSYLKIKALAIASVARAAEFFLQYILALI